jgi:hypothetical protein
MIYIVKKKTKTHQSIDALFVKAETIRKDIIGLMKKHDAGNQYVHPMGAWFGIDAVLFDTGGKPDKKQWKSKKIDDLQAWIPRSGSQAEKDLKAIAVVNYSDLAALLKYDPQHGPASGREHGRLLSLTPGFEVVGTTYVVTTDDWVKWRPCNDLKEITMGELEKMKAKPKKKK